MLSSFAISVCPNVLMLVELPSLVCLSAEVDIIKREAGTGSGPTAHVEAVDIKVLYRLTCAIVSEVMCVSVAELAVDVIADLECVVSHLQEHLNVNNLVTGNGSKYVTGYGLTVDVEGAVTIRFYSKNVNRVAVPCAVSIPVGVVTSGHYDNAHFLSDSACLKVECIYTERALAEVLHRVCVVHIIGGTVDHVLRSLLACSDSVHTVCNVDRGITVLSEEEIALACAGVDESLINSEGITTSCTAVGKVVTFNGSNRSMSSYRSAFSLATSVCTGGRIVTGSGKHIVSGSCNRLSNARKLCATAGECTVNNFVEGTFNFTLRSYFVLYYCRTGSMSCKFAGLSATVGAVRKSDTGSGYPSMSERLFRGVTTATSTGPVLAACSIICHKVLKSSAFVSDGVGYGTAVVYTSSGLSTVYAALLRACIVSVFTPLVIKLGNIGVNGRGDSITVHTSVNHVVAAGSSTGCFNDVFLLRITPRCMRESFIINLFYNPCRTVVTELTCRIAGLSAGCVLAVILSGVKVAGSGDGGLSYGECLTYRTLLTVGKTVGGTGSCVAEYVNLGMSLHGDDILLYEYGVTNGTLLTIGKTGCCTSRIMAENHFFSVAKSRNNFLFGSYGLTNRALSALGKTGCGTGGSYSLKSDVILVTERSSLCVVTYDTSLGSGTGSIAPVMVECFAVSSLASLAGCGGGTSCLGPIVTKCFALSFAT